MSGFTIKDGISTTEPSGWVVESRLGLTADRLRVVDYLHSEAAYLFRAPGKKVTAEEAKQYGISALNPYSPKPWPAPVVKEANSPKDKAIEQPAKKMVEPPENKGWLKKAKR